MMCCQKWLISSIISVPKYYKRKGKKFTTYHKPSHLCGVMNSYAFWSDFSEKQNGNLVWLQREKINQIYEKKLYWSIQTCTPYALFCDQFDAIYMIEKIIYNSIVNPITKQQKNNIKLGRYILHPIMLSKLLSMESLNVWIQIMNHIIPPFLSYSKVS